MRTLATLATLFVGLSFVFWAPAAKADCPHNGKFNHPHCGGGETLENRISALEELAPRYVFVTSQVYSGNLVQEAINAGLGPVLDGPDGADKLCQAAADGPSPDYSRCPVKEVVSVD